jgi:hypothetical protein
MSYQGTQESYLGNPLVKRDGVNIDMEPWQVIEYQKCLLDPVYFARNYLKVINLDDGLVNFDLYPYQEKMYHLFQKQRFIINLACRQSGKSIGAVGYILWFAIFHPEKNVAILANKGATAMEMIARITLMLENLPFWLQPGCKSLNRKSIHFSNNSKIMSAATSGSSIRGVSIHLLYLDEFAFVENDVEFFTSTYPVISSGKTTQVIITSTANGVGNMFHKLWQGAITGQNKYIPFRVDWWDVPGRDEEWKEETIANTSEHQFEQEFGNSFMATGSTLVATDTILKMCAQAPVYIEGSFKSFEKPIEDHSYVMCVDTAKGRGQDSSAFTIIDVTSKPFKQVAVYNDNMISPMLYPDIIVKWANIYNEAYIVAESNDQGIIVVNAIYYEHEYENMHVESVIKSDAIGLTMSKKVKKIGCSQFKDLCEQNNLEIVDSDTIREISTFESKGQSYEASMGNHDDIVMSLVIFGWFTSTDLFHNMTDINIREMLFEEKMKMIENELPGFGFIQDGNTTDKEVVDGDVWSTEDPVLDEYDRKALGWDVDDVFGPIRKDW